MGVSSDPGFITGPAFFGICAGILRLRQMQTDPGHPLMIHLQNPQRVTLGGSDSVAGGRYLVEEACNVAADRIIIFRFKAGSQHIVDIIEFNSSLNNIIAAGNLPDLIIFVGVILIVNLAHQFLKNIFQCNQAGYSPIFIQYDGHGNGAAAHFHQKIRGFLGFKSEVRLVHEPGNAEFFRGREHEILDIENSDNMIPVMTVDRQAGVFFRAVNFPDFFVRIVFVDADHVNTGHHDIAGTGFIQIENVVNHLVLLHLDGSIVTAGIDKCTKIIFGDHVLPAGSGMEQAHQKSGKCIGDGNDRRHDPHQRPDDRRVRKGEFFRPDGSQIFGSDFPEDKDEQCQDSRCDSDRAAAEYVDGQRCSQGGSVQIDDVVADQDGAEHFGGMSQYFFHDYSTAVSAFGDTTANAVSTVSGCTAWQITNNKSGEWNKVIVALNNSASAKSISCSGSWTVVANGTKAGTTSLGTASGSYSVPAWSSVVLVDSASFGNYTQPTPGTASLTVEHYTRDDASGSYTKVATQTAKYKEGQTWRASQDLSILFDHDFDKAESTAAGNATFGAAAAGQDITVKYYYTRNIGSAYLTVNFLDSTSGEAVKTPMKYRLKDGAEYSIPATRVQGYQLDMTKFPKDTIGTFEAANPATFNFYYNALTNTSTIVHYYNSKSWSWVNCYAYDDQGNEALGAWANQGRRDASAMKDDPDQSDSKWVVVTVPTAACYVMFHNTNANAQVPDQGEPGYEVSGEAWIKDNVVSFNCTIVTSHIDLATGERVAADEVKDYTNVRSNQVYTTSPNTSLNRDYIAPALASGFYQPGVLNVVYLYTGETQHGDKLLYGDLDLDGVNTVMDVTVLQRYLVGMITLSDDQKTVADVNQDKEIDAIDVTYIMRYLCDMRVSGTYVGKYVGDGPSGKYTYSEFLSAYNALNSLFAKYDSTKFASEAAYQNASAALSGYRTATMNPSSSADVIDAGYEACTAAYAALSQLDPNTGGGGGEDDNGRTIIFSNNKGFQSVNIYYWASGSEGPVAWPGVPMTYLDTNEYGENRYTFDLPEGMDKYIITDGTAQTIDVDFTGSTGVYMLDTTDAQGHYEVGFYDISGESGGGGGQQGGGESTGSFLLTDNFGWGTAYVYAWDADGNAIGGEWPGTTQAETVTNDYGETQFRCYVPEGAVGIVVHNGNGSQTEDITDFSYDGYWMDGTQNDQGHYIVTGWNN